VGPLPKRVLDTSGNLTELAFPIAPKSLRPVSSVERTKGLLMARFITKIVGQKKFLRR
jgi:hypothetical protein